MNIVDHILHDDDRPVNLVESPNRGGRLEPRYLVIHYTAGRDAAGSIRWLSDEAARASAHLVIARDGTVTQLVPFDQVAWHAGVSRWNGVQGLNRHSIGIELDNAGKLERKGGRWCAWFGDAFEEDEVMVATHRHDDRPCGWHLYPPAQLDATLEVARALIRTYGLREVLGHEDISPGRKSDPGPAFPMGSFRARLLGRSEDRAPLYETTVALNIRRGAGTGFDKLDASPLPPGTPLEILDERGSWKLVNVMGEVGGEGDVQGWVHGRFIRLAD